MKYIIIPNFQKFQHYKDGRRPDWIKLLVEIIDEYDKTATPKKFWKITDAAKLTFILLACLRSRYSDKIPYPDDKWLKSQLGIQRLDLQPLVDAGFITVSDEPVQICTDSYENGTLEGEGEREEEGEGERKSRPSFFDLWNTKKNLPRITAISKSRKEKLALRLNEKPFADNQQAIIEKICASSFCLGKNDRNWKVGIDWILENDKNYLKVLEGKYDDHKQKTFEHRRCACGRIAQQGKPECTVCEEARIRKALVND